MISSPREFVGRWHIDEMEVWDRDALDLVVPAHISFGGDGLGRLEFIAISSDVDYRVVERTGSPAVEFSWEGEEEYDRRSGRGWAVLERGKLRGMMFIHRGDESEFVASRQE